jgi:hypothetical protein
MTEEEWFEFIQRGQPAMVSVGRLSQELCSVILCSTSLVRMDHDYALKALLKHAVLPHHFRFISWAIEGGTATHDKPNHLTFFWLDGMRVGSTSPSKPTQPATNFG